MKQNKYLITGDDIATMGLTLLPGKTELSGNKALTRKDILDNYLVEIAGITDDNRLVTYERVSSSVYLNLNKNTLNFTAAGGSDTITIDTNLDDSQLSINTVSGFTVSRSGKTITVTANNLGTTIVNAKSAVLTVSGEGLTTSCTLNQAGNYVTKFSFSGGSLSYPTIGAGATSATPSVAGMDVHSIYSSGSAKYGWPDSTYGTFSSFRTVFSLGSVVNGFTEVNSVSGVLTATNRGTTVGDARTSGVVTRTVTVVWAPIPEYSAGGTITGTGALTATCTQEANTLTWGTPVISRTTPVSIAATGGTNNVATGLTYSQKGTYTSGSTTTASSGGTLSCAVQTAKTGFSLSGSTVTVTNNTSTSARNGFVVRITLALNGKTTTKDITYNQSAGYYTYANPVVTVKCNDVPASGGSVTSGTATYSQTYGWNGTTSGAGTVTSGGSVSWSGGASNIASLGTTIKARSIVGSKLTATVTLNSKTGTGSVDVYQALNKVVSCTETGNTLSYPSISANGGTSTPVNTNTARFAYSSGATGDPKGYIATKSFTMTPATGFSINSNTGVITATVNNSTSSRISGTVTRTTKFSYTNPESVGGDVVSATLIKTATCTQNAGTKTYADPVVTLSYPVIPAGGGTGC